MIYLFDINVLLALAWQSHEHHARASRWLSGKEKLQIATCPLTELGFLRLSMQLFHADFSSAARLLEIMVGRPQFKHQFWNDDFSPVLLAHGRHPISGAKQLNDFFLSEMAGRHSAKFATLDARIPHAVVELVS